MFYYIIPFNISFECLRLYSSTRVICYNSPVKSRLMDFKILIYFLIL